MVTNARPTGRLEHQSGRCDAEVPVVRSYPYAVRAMLVFAPEIRQPTGLAVVPKEGYGDRLNLISH